VNERAYKLVTFVLSGNQTSLTCFFRGNYVRTIDSDEAIAKAQSAGAGDGDGGKIGTCGGLFGHEGILQGRVIPRLAKLAKQGVPRHKARQTTVM
jgi:hypothetical protein